ncbi:MAG TPA: FAD-dependent oxidoreductase [Syntrophomonadaceae bacterium]|nr:FAD-dependent oxidoreductase [Syntrophomonadaceae bacterium]HNX29804.1 FAD-dependent oxidoreductase [Syntrophomonadaceae bacterium]HPR94324.1 FAD-dependent oxidoreductase [Syntrophomonadaceae bacterium]
MGNEEKVNGVSRRAFIKGAAVSTVALGSVGSIIGCSPKEKEPATEPETQVESAAPSFLKAPDPIADADIKETVTADVIVVGGGMSGLCAAMSAAEDGAKVILLEKTERVNFRGNDYGAIGTKLQKQINNEINKIDAVQEIMRYNAYKGNQRVVSLWAENSGKVADWIMAKAEGYGCKPKAVPLDETVTPGTTVKGFPTLSFRMEPSEVATADAPTGTHPWTASMRYTLKQGCIDTGVDIRYKTPAVQLVRKDNKGRVTAVIAGEKGAYKKFVGTKAIILCSGDYNSDQEMREYYIPSTKYMHANMYEMVDGDHNTGDGQKMGMWIGAAMDEFPHAPMYFDFAVPGAPILADALMRQPWLSVNEKGLRYENEELPYAYLSNAQRQQPGNARWTVWDAKWPDEAPSFKVVACKDMRTSFHNPENVKTYIEKGYIKSAETLEELADKMGVPKENFLKTVERYNELARKGVDEDFGKRAACLTTIEKPTFYASPLGTALLVTLGGLKINEQLQVLDEELNIIPGLYAAGNASGSYYANDYCVNLPGNSHGRAFTFGYLAGKNAVKLG